ncbi:50S ribosomal protein L23 [Mycoplasma sp. AC157]|uniref:50S ribosomal protein L23 n=1 Tax=Mycoplasma sp. 480 TaxID=3440155 RepID=UPI003F516757
MNINEIIKYPILTEKSYLQMSSGTYVFAVDRRTNRSEVKKAVEYIFNVKVEKVNIFNVPKKPAKLGRYQGFTNSFKKAIVTLVEGHTIAVLNEDLESPTPEEQTNVVEETKKETKVSKSASEVDKKVAEKIAAKKNKEKK